MEFTFYVIQRRDNTPPEVTYLDLSQKTASYYLELENIKSFSI